MPRLRVLGGLGGLLLLGCARLNPAYGDDAADATEGVSGTSDEDLDDLRALGYLGNGEGPGDG